MELVSYENSFQWPNQNSLVPKILLKSASKPFSEHCQINAQHDLEAIQCWLQHYKQSLNTYKTYYKEARRLLLWCVYEKGLALGGLKVQDIEEYFNFLKNPPAHWFIAPPASIPPEKTSWLPLKGPLSETACRMSLRAINSLMNYLVKADYLRTNPLKLLPASITKSLEMDVQKYKVWERMLEADEWTAVQKALEDMPSETTREIDNKMRTQFLFALLYLLGLRIHEVAISSWNAFRKRNDSWWFFIKGKGGKLGHIPVNEQLISYVKAYRLHLKLSPLPNIDEATPLLVSKKSKRPLKVRQLYGLVKSIGVESAKAFKDQPLKKKKLEQISPHWLRHLSASHQDKAGISATIIQANHRHGSSRTTQIYLHAEDELRSTEIEKLRMDLDPKFVHPITLAQKYECKIKLKGRSILGKANLSRLLDSLESNIFKGLSWERRELNKDELLDRYEHLKKFGSPLQFSYYFGSLEGSALNTIKQWVVREANVRLFECDIEWKSGV